jgi:hypothetical protein
MKGTGVIFGLLFLSTTAFALDQNVALKGITTVNIMVSDLSDDLLKDSVSVDYISRTLELGLRSVGLTALSASQYDITVPTVTLRVLSIKEPDGRFYATNTVLASVDNVSNLRTPGIFTATIWSNDLLRLLGRVDIARVIEGEKQLIDLFLNNYSQANPKVNLC